MVTYSAQPVGEANLTPDQADAHWRSAVADRLHLATVRLAEHAWVLRRSRPLAPHAVLFLYAADQVYAATRVFHDDPSIREPEVLLYRLARIPDAFYPHGFDPLQTMATNISDVPRRRGLWYAGTALVTLDTSDDAGRLRRWEQVRDAAADWPAVPAAAYAILRDGTEMVLQRRAAHEQHQVWSTGNLDTVPGLPTRRWTSYQTVRTPARQMMWAWLTQLHHVAVAGR